MRKAYDTFLLSEVSADLAAKAGSFEPYRYECAHCGEVVRLAAVGSTSMVPHFRHLSGNSDVECDYYLGQYGAFIADACSRKSKNERAEFYFDSNTKMFYLGLRFSKEEISAYEQLSTTFELRVAPQEQSFYSLRINCRNFTPDMQRLIPLEKFSRSYYLSNTLNGVKRKYELFNNRANNAATFFKMQVGDSGYRAKLVRSSVLYTNITYFVAFLCQSHWSTVDIRLPSEIMVNSTFGFETMGRKFLGKVLTITSKTAQVESLLLSWGYQLEAAETLTLLWPPAILSEDVSLIDADTAYLYATFELQAHGNINVHSEDIIKFSNELTTVAVKSKVIVYKKNAELILESHKQELDVYTELPVVHRTESVFQVVDDTSFMFNRSGILPLSKGAIAQMTPASEVRHYSNGYLDGIVAPPKPAIISGEELLQDALIHYKRIEPLNWDDFKSLDLSQLAFKYIENCEKAKLINSAAKLLIKEGRI